jgi:ABC-type antimicrobial peptide transport system, ATPase component
MISIKNLNVCYGKNVILSDSEIDIPIGSTVLLCGESGSGKTSVLEYLTFSQSLNNEEYFIDKIRVDFTDEKTINALKSEKMVYVDQNFQLFDLNVERNLRMFYQMNPQNKNMKKFIESLDLLLAFVNLDKSLKHKKINVLSGGERQRLALACAIAKNTPIIILDEPMSNLDSESQEIIADVIHTLSQRGKTIVIATHKEDMYEANIIYRIVDKKLVKETKKETMDHSKLGKYSNARIHYSNLWRPMYKLNEIVMTLFISFGLALSCIIFMNGNVNITQQIKEFKGNTSQEILVFSSIHDKASFSDELTILSDYDPPLNEQLVKELATIDHVASAYPFEIFGSDYSFVEHDGSYGDYTVEDGLVIVSYPDGTNVTKKMNMEEGVSSIPKNYIVAFDSDAQREQITDYQGIKDGIYITPELAETLEIENIEGVYLTFKTLVPIASCETIIQITSENEPMVELLGRSPISVLWEFHVPIAGIKNENYVSHYTYVCGNTFYMDYRQMQTIKDEASVEYVDGIENYQYNDENPILEEQWRTAGCLLYLDDMDSMGEVGTKVVQIDESIILMSTNSEYNQLYSLIVNIRNKQYFISAVVGVVLVFAVSLFKFVRFSKDIKNLNILKRNGIIINRLNGSKLMVESLVELIISATVISVFINRINDNYNLIVAEQKFMDWSLEGALLLLMEIVTIIFLSIGLYQMIAFREKEKRK